MPSREGPKGTNVWPETLVMPAVNFALSTRINHADLILFTVAG